MNEITYNGKNLSDFGVYYDSHSAFGSPERDVELVEVAGKDGALIIDNDRFKNIDLTFPCYINTNFLAQYRNALAYLQSCKGYNRLEYTQEPNHFRMASFNMGSQPTPNQFHKSGQFPVVFNCKPQRFLKSGETPVSSQSQDEEYEGNPSVINNPSGLSTVKSLEVGLEPIQNLNGYEYPWVGGAGKNLLNMANIQIGKAWNTTTNNDHAIVYMDCEPDTNYAISINDRSAFSAIVWCEKASADATTNTYLTTFSSNATSFKTKSTSNVICIQFSKTGISANDFNGIEVQIEKGTVNTSYEPYSNICPISGHTEVNVTRTGKNLLNPSTLLTGYYADKDANDTSGSATTYRTAELALTQGTYTISFSTAVNIVRYREKGITSSNNVATGVKAYTFTISTDATVALGFRIPNESWDDSTTIQIELGSTATSYEPYTGTTYTSSLGTTVYGGTLDIVSGVLTVTHGFKDLGDCSWTYYGSGFPSLFYTDTLKTLIGQTGGNYTHGICSCYKMVDNTHNNGTYGSDTAQPNGSMRFRNTDGRIYIVDERFTDATALTSALSGETVVFELHDPVTYNLTPTQVSLLTGVNVITTDGNGDMTVTVTEPTLLVNPTLFESKPLLRIYGTGTVNINDKYITISAHSFPYIDIDCELMDAYYGSSNANQYVTFSDNDYITLKSGNNYIAYGNQIEVTPRWYEI